MRMTPVMDRVLAELLFANRAKFKGVGRGALLVDREPFRRATECAGIRQLIGERRMNVLQGPRLLGNERYMAIAPGALGSAHMREHRRRFEIDVANLRPIERAPLHTKGKRRG